MRRSSTFTTRQSNTFFPPFGYRLAAVLSCNAFYCRDWKLRNFWVADEPSIWASKRCALHATWRCSSVNSHCALRSHPPATAPWKVQCAETNPSRGRWTLLEFALGCVLNGPEQPLPHAPD